jgi:hypothetical protein
MRHNDASSRCLGRRPCKNDPAKVPVGMERALVAEGVKYPAFSFKPNAYARESAGVCKRRVGVKVID